MILTIVSFTIVEEINLWSVIRLVIREKQLKAQKTSGTPRVPFLEKTLFTLYAKER